MVWNDVQLERVNDFTPTVREYAPQAERGPSIEAANDFSDWVPNWGEGEVSQPYYPTIESVYAPSRPSPAPVIQTVNIQGTVIPQASITTAASKVASEGKNLSVGGQSVIPSSDGGRTTVTKQTANSYIVQKYSADGHLVSSEVRYIDSGQVVQSALPKGGSSADQSSTSATPPQASKPSESAISKVFADMGIKAEDKSTAKSSAISAISSVQSAPYAGSSEWQKTNEPGTAPIISQIDYSAVLGATGLGKYLLQKVSAPAIKAIISGADDIDKDELKYKLETGQISDDEYYDLIDDYVKQTVEGTGKSLPEVLKSVSDDLTDISKSGGFQVSENASKALYKYLVDHGYVEADSESNVKTKGLIGDAWESVSNALPFLKRTDDTVSVAAAAVTNPLSQPVPAPSSAEPVSVDSLRTPSTVSPFASSVVATGASSTLEIVPSGGREYPVTEEEKANAALDYLDKVYPDQAGEGKNNELVAKYFWYLVPEMSQYGIDYQAVSESTREYEDLFKEKSPLLFEFVAGSERIGLINGSKTKLTDFNLDNQKRVIAGWNKKLIERGLPAPVIALFNAGLSQSSYDATGQPLVQNWMTSGEMYRDIKSDPIWNLKTEAMDFLSSPQGMAATGAGLGLISTAGAFMVAGPIGAVASLGTLPFSTTEFIQSFGEFAWKTKGELQLKGEYSQDHVYAYNQNYNTASDSIKNIGISKSLSDPSVNLQNIQSGRDALKELEKTLDLKWVYLAAAGVYDDKVRQIETLRKGLETNIAMFDSSGNFIAKELPPVEISVINTKPEWKLEYGSLKLSADGSGKMGKIDTNFTGDFVVYDSNGKEIGRQQVKSELFSGDRIIDVESIVSQTQKYGKSAEVKPDKIVTVNLQPGYVMTIGGAVYEGGGGGKSYDVAVQSGAPTELLISAPGKSASKTKLYWDDGTWSSYTPTLNDAFKTVTKAEFAQGINLDVPSNAQVKINGAVVDTSKDYNKKLYLDAGYYAVEIAVEGKKTLQKNIYVGDDQFITVSGPAEDEAVKKTYSSGGGGGGGGSSSSSKKTVISYALIVYGETCRDATIYQDEIEIAPVIGQTYSIEPGYHSIKVVRAGKKEWLKTVYCAVGDTITVSPAFEDITDDGTGDDAGDDAGDDTGDGTIEPDWKRVFINSNPSGAKVLLNGSATGQWTPCYLDLPYGYYVISTIKTGYKAIEKTLYVGSIIAWGSQADYLANLEGLI